MSLFFLITSKEYSIYLFSNTIKCKIIHSKLECKCCRFGYKFVQKISRLLLR